MERRRAVHCWCRQGAADCGHRWAGWLPLGAAPILAGLRSQPTAASNPGACVCERLLSPPAPKQTSSCAPPASSPAAWPTLSLGGWVRCRLGTTQAGWARCLASTTGSNSIVWRSSQSGTQMASAAAATKSDGVSCHSCRQPPAPLPLPLSVMLDSRCPCHPPTAMQAGLYCP